ncbi:hypothetical protein BEWA_025940 [Theileria equi strain WA]|uniref:Serine aminopeptidase S33 domain-containing protein n=1 Tax=Theileria equi strain WA TaxID=1537102 RepID=L0AW18_THEEQ|nr:hypothetical protein BEWA_025940 [Theileria equi strain WA]AFZ79745.1 hypothetical protein BEWA_025940 [Theileria equi strain WA]|eukprot:XP_004829411.1 hypothetical protein BEWA_025940 [Theileria equi strain WA]
MRVFLILCVLVLRQTCSLAVPQGPEGEVILDLSSPDSSSIDTFTRKPYGLLQTIHVARDCSRITSVVDGGTFLWKNKKDGNHCTHVTVLTHETTHANIYLKNVEGIRSCFYLEKSGEEWKQITGKEFYDRLHSVVKRNADFDRVTLNISKTPDPKIFYVNKAPEFPFTVYAANSKCRITKIKDGWTTTIWEDKTKDKGCMYVSFYPKKDPKWAYLLFLNSDGFKEEFLGKTKNACRATWNAITREEYLEGIRKAGFNESTFKNHIKLDLSKPSDSFHKHSYITGGCSERLFTPLPGLLLTSVTDGMDAVWTAKDGEYCTYANVFHYDGKAITMYLLTKGPKGDRRILYFAKSGKEWKSIDKEGYFSATSGNDPLAPPKEVAHELTMSSFKNRQGLRLISYASKVENAKADIILSHGMRGHFIDFNVLNPEWNSRHFDFPTYSYASPFGGYKPSPEPNPMDIYRHIFENPAIHGDSIKASPRYGYRGGFAEALNRLGYNVYSFDMQSYGLSEAASDLRCYVNNFKDYVYDLMQFVSIVKRGKFGDPNEKWDEKIVYKNIPTDKKTFLLGFSMGGNIAVQAVQEFYKHAKEGTRLVDGLVGLSAMLSLENYMTTIMQKIKFQGLKFLAWKKPHSENTYDKLDRHGESFNNFMRCHDPFFLARRVTFKATRLLFSATEDANKDKKNMVHYPKNLPTLFLHTRDDARCSVNGPRKMVNEKLKESKVAKFVELEGACHYLTFYQSIAAVIPHLKKWLDQYA